MPGLADAAAAFCLDLVVPGDVQPVPGAAAGGEQTPPSGETGDSDVIDAEYKAQ